MVPVTRVQVLDKAVYIFHITNTLWKKNESNYYSSRYELIVGQTWLFNLGMAAGQGEGKLNLNLLNSV